jgi:hypothetical protein
MANDTEVGLIWRLRAQGTQQVQAELRRLTGGVQQTRAAAERAPSMGGWRTSFGSVQAQATGLLGTLGKLAGFAGLGVGLFGLDAVRRDFVALDDVLLEIQNSQGLTDDATAALGKRFHEMGWEAGKSAAEIATLADSVSDISGQWNRALEAAPKLSLYARSINLGDTSAVAETFAGLEKIGGGTLPVMRQLAMLREMQRSTPMSEANFMAAASKAAGPAGDVGNLRGEAGIRSLGGIIATLGKTYALQPRKIQGGMDQLLDVFQDEKMRTAIRGLGVDTTNIGTMFEGLLRKLKDSPKALDGIEGLADEFKIIMRGAVTNVETFRAAQRQITGNTQALGADLERTEHSMAVSMGRVAESLKTALEPIVAALAETLGKPETQAKIAALGRFLGALGAWAAENGQTVLAFFAALAIRARLPQGAGGVPLFPGATGAGGGGAPMLLGAPGAQAAGSGAGAPASSGAPPWQAGSQAQQDMRAFRAAQGATPTALGPVTNMPLIAAAAQANTLFTQQQVNSALLATETPEEQQRRVRRRAGRSLGSSAAMVATAVATNDSMQRAIQDGLAQAKIALTLNANISPDGITAQATARQNGRSAQSPIVRQSRGVMTG